MGMKRIQLGCIASKKILDVPSNPCCSEVLGASHRSPAYLAYLLSAVEDVISQRLLNVLQSGEALHLFFSILLHKTGPTQDSTNSNIKEQS